MDIHGHLWVFMDIHGYLWTCHRKPFFDIRRNSVLNSFLVHRVWQLSSNFYVEKNGTSDDRDVRFTFQALVHSVH